jgi:uncharacterized protein YraI
MKPIYFVLLCILAASLLIAGCFGNREVSEEAPAPLRSPHPTFTPTPMQPPTPVPPPAAADAPTMAAVAAPADAAAPDAQAATDAQTALAVISEDLINIRRGPGLEYPPLRLGMRGDEFTIIGRSADDLWWQICCVEELPAWVSKTYVEADGPVDAIPVADPNAAAQEGVIQAPTATPAPVVQNQPASVAPTEAPPVEAPPAEAAPEEPTPPAAESAPAFPFVLAAQESFPENNNLVRIFLYVYQGETALPGYTLRVTQDGAELPVSGVSADAAGMTWPTASPRQRFQNLKVEFPGVNPGGTWEIQLIDGGGAAVGPLATFTMSATDTNRELYLRYEKQ